MCTNTIHPFGIQCRSFKCGIQKIHLIGDYQSPNLSKVEFKFKLSGFKLFFGRIAYRDLFSQMHALCQRHTFNHCNEPQWLNSRVKFTCGFSHSQGRYDAWNSRITTGLWQNPRPEYTLAKSWKTVSCHECKVWLPHGRLKASLGPTELKKAKLIRWHLNVRLFKRKINQNCSVKQDLELTKWRHAGSWVSLIP